VLTTYSAPLPPPHAWTKTIAIGPAPVGLAEISVEDSFPPWSQAFPLYDSHLDWLFEVVHSQGAFEIDWRERRDIPVGGGGRHLSLVAKGVKIEISEYVAEELVERVRTMMDAVRALVPKQVMDALNGRHETFVKDRLKALRRR
jgi:hypothetical protein